MDDAEVRRQTQTLLDGLKTAGVDLVPKLAAPPRRVVVNPATDNATEPAAAPASGLAGNRKALEVLAAEVASCTKCPALASSRTQTVFADGPPGNVDLCFLGEAPGADEDAQGLPFVGAAGQLLNKIIAACGMTREEVYICNILKCRPPGNRKPQADEVANCTPYLKRQLDIVKPKYICCLGATAANFLLDNTKPVGQLRKKFHEWNGIPVIVTYHPAYLLPHRSPGSKKDVWEDMKMLLTKMGRPIPVRKDDEKG